MEEILLNPGYHFIAQRILSNLDSKTLSSLSQTSKRIMKVYENFMIEKGQWNSIFENLECQFCEDVFTDTFQDFVSFVEENEIFYPEYFKPLEAKSEKKHILVLFLEKLTQFTMQENLEPIEKQIRKYCDCQWTYMVPMFEVNRKIQLIISQYVKFIPSNGPPESKSHLMRLLAFATSWEKLDMVKVLVASMKNHDTCLRLTISAYKYHRKAGTSVKDHYKTMNDQMVSFMKKIIVQCKNPNSPNESGSTAMHLVAKLGMNKIAKVLLPYCKNLDKKDQDGKTVLDIANENRHYKTVKILRSAL